jgi:hypothetical protein
MTRFVELPGRVPGASVSMTERWINPEHVVSVKPRFSGVQPSVELIVELKLEGLPIFEAWFGVFDSVAAADAVWQVFLHDISE